MCFILSEFGKDRSSQSRPDIADRHQIVLDGRGLSPAVHHLTIERHLRALAGGELDVGWGKQLGRRDQLVNIDP